MPWLPTWRTRPDALAAAIIGAPSSMTSVMGFSTYTCLPARSASTTCVRCQWSGVATITASIDGSARSAFQSP